MCFCCCCGCCDNQTSKCIEVQIFIFSLLNLISAILGFSIIKWSHISQTCLIFWFVLGGFALFEIFFIILIICWRIKTSINVSKNSCAICLARMGFLFTIFSFFIAIIAEAMSRDNLDETDHPCRYLEEERRRNNTDPSIILFRQLRQLNLMSEEEKRVICKEIDEPETDMKYCSELEKLIAYIAPSIFEICSFVLICFWWQDQRRIRSRVDGALGGKPADQVTNRRRSAYEMGGAGLEDYYGGGINYDIYGRPVYPEQSIGSQMINVHSSSASSRRLSSGVNMNFSRYGQNGGRGYGNRGGNNSSINESAGEEASNNGSEIGKNGNKKNEDNESESEESNNAPAPNDVVVVGNRRKTQRGGGTAIGKNNGNANNGNNRYENELLGNYGNKSPNGNNGYDLNKYDKKLGYGTTSQNQNNASVGTNIMSVNQSSGNNYSSKNNNSNGQSGQSNQSEIGSEASNDF